jgi:hypothetical protein
MVTLEKDGAQKTLSNPEMIEKLKADGWIEASSEKQVEAPTKRTRKAKGE